MTNALPYRILALTLLLVAWGAGCAGKPSGKGSFQPALVEPNRAVIYVFRPSGGRSASTTTQVFLNQDAEGEIRSGEYIQCIVEPGSYLVRVEANSSMVRGVTLIAGDVAYLMVTMKRGAKPVIEDTEPELARRLIAGTERVHAAESH